MSESSQAKTPHHPIGFIYYLIFTAMICGAIVMVIEVLGSRVIGPFFGASLFVWTSLITVALVGLALGYALGGLMSDKKGSPAYLYSIILFSGFLVLSIPLIKSTVLLTCLPLGLRGGALVSSTLLFGPSMITLGCVSPYIIKIAAREMHNIGRTVGLFYALSTIGSFIGTLLTGFVLISMFSVNQIFSGVGLLLIILAVGFFILFGDKRLSIVAILAPLFLFYSEPLKSMTLKNGTKATQVLDIDTFYGNIKVVDYTYENKHIRDMLIDGQIQGGMDMNSRMSAYSYAYFLEFLPYSLNPDGKNCLVIGLGTGMVPVWYEKKGVITDVLDINPKVVEIAKNNFGFKVSGETIISDARYYLNSSSKKYDYIILDVFSGDTTPGHILSAESLQLVENRMSPKGILALNLAGSLKKETFITASIIKTLKSVFNVVKIFPVFDSIGGDGLGNLEVLAYNYSFAGFNKEIIEDEPINWSCKKEVEKYLWKEFKGNIDDKAIILSDNYNPSDVYDIWLKERIRKGILESTDPHILL